MVRSSASTERGETSSRLGLVIILIFGLLFDPLIGSLAWFHYKTDSHRKNIHRKIKEGELREGLVLLSFTIDEARARLKWLSPEEFEYDHKLYDVVEARRVGEKIEYLCWPDQEEQEVETRIEEIIEMAFSPDRRDKLARMSCYLNHPDPYSKSLWAVMAFSDNAMGPGWNLNPHRAPAVRPISVDIPPPTPPPQFPG